MAGTAGVRRRDARGRTSVTRAMEDAQREAERAFRESEPGMDAAMREAERGIQQGLEHAQREIERAARLSLDDRSARRFARQIDEAMRRLDARRGDIEQHARKLAEQAVTMQREVLRAHRGELTVMSEQQARAIREQARQIAEHARQLAAVARELAQSSRSMHIGRIG